TPFVFNVDINMGDALSFHGLRHQLLFNPRRYENFEIFLNITRAQDSFVLEWSYNTQLFKASTIQRMMAEYESLLQDIAASPEQPIARLNLLSASQVAQLAAWNDTAHDFGNVASFIELF